MNSNLSVIAGLGNPEKKHSKTLHNAGFWFVDEIASQNDIEFSKLVTSPFETFIFDAFGASHRQHASVVSFGNFLNSYQGPLMNKEISELGKILEQQLLKFNILQ